MDHDFESYPFGYTINDTISYSLMGVKKRISFETNRNFFDERKLRKMIWELNEKMDLRFVVRIENSFN